ncbi:HAMP domain-containing histidine kinase [Cohnella terricola]|uniref:histidine kinase n=2 Tax=Cohnella terricola TaxID=1289167 RepID=A0A559JWT1_9BACL|nr:HAMP domain-containing histidine kinase [Cohnella terricola]
MKIRTKLMLSMSILIVFILFSLLAVTHIQFFIVRDLAYYKDKVAFKLLQEEFEQYYADHNDSWEGVHDEQFEHSRGFAEIAMVVGGKTLYQQGRLDIEIMQADGFHISLHEHDQKIGRLFVMNDSQYKTYEFKNMWYNILPNTLLVSLLLTAVAALGIIFLLSWRMTRPIRKIVAGIHGIRQGDANVIFPVRRKDEFGAISRALQEMNQSLASAEQSRKQLLSDVAHELKTPLMVIQGEMELAQERDVPLTPEKLSSLLDEVLRLSRLVHDVLDLSKLEAGGTELRPTAENIVEMVSVLIEKTQFLAEDKHIGLSMHASEDVIEVSVEKSRILHALYNILINAIHYTNEGGQVQLHVERMYSPDLQDEVVRIVIEDNGVGIPQEDLPHIFNRFYRADHSRSRPNGGTGLGLAIAQQNIVVHKGWIEVRSEAVKGTAFSVFLPIAKERVRENL